MRLPEPIAWVGRILTWVVLLAVVGVLLVAVLVPGLVGATPYTVLTGSMRPDLPPGTLVVVKPKDFEEIAVGEVITFQLESGRAAVATHRVAAINVGMDGERLLRTRGDANGALDQEPVREAQVKGEVRYAVPYVGWVSRWLDGSQRQLAVYVVAGLLLGYAAFMLTSAARDRRRDRRAASTQPSTEDEQPVEVGS